jgi:hypothetical protein
MKLFRQKNIHFFSRDCYKRISIFCWANCCTSVVSLVQFSSPEYLVEGGVEIFYREKSAVVSHLNTNHNVYCLGTQHRLRCQDRKINMQTLHVVTLTLALSLSNFSVVQGYPDRRSMRVQDIADRFKTYHMTNTDRALTVPIITPVGCDYVFQHDPARLVDTISCPDECGDGQDFTFTVTTICTDATRLDCVSYADCRVIGCNDECGSGAGDCPCADYFESLDEVCEDICMGLAERIMNDRPSFVDKDERELTHAIQQDTSPDGCSLTYDHDLGEGFLRDELFCEDWCGPGRNVLFSFTSVNCTGFPGDCTIFFDCVVDGCNDDCGTQVARIATIFCFLKRFARRSTPQLLPQLRRPKFASPSFVFLRNNNDTHFLFSSRL